ncbi:MAG: alpha-glucosidase/alpha-galactosidase [Kiritimatiellae bacterium]|nr:alpha-glucosidase/alpha-galactosidase [Kiritimatiellia bacterium]
MAKIVMIGAGSPFGGRLCLDVMSREGLRDSTVCLCDLHEGRLGRVAEFARKAAEQFGLPTTIEASTDRTQLLPEADFVVTSIRVGDMKYAKLAGDIPRKYGVDQTIADTVGIGGVFKLFRAGPVQRQFFRDMERLCPNALVLNHTNPMAMLSWLHLIDSPMAYVGLCHSVQGTTQKLARLAGVPYKDVNYKVAGINHLSWVLELRRGKEDLYPRLRQAAEDPETVGTDKVRFELMRQFGYFPTESSQHNSEYLPYFRRTAEMRDAYFPPDRVRKEREARTTAPVPMWRQWQLWMNGKAEMPEPQLHHSNEYTIGIMDAVVTDVPFRFNGNVLNHGLIDNLPAGCCVEVPCIADAQGVRPVRVGALPPQLAALDRSNIAVQELAVRALLDRDREAAFHACALDPLTAATATLPVIRQIFDELWDAYKDLLAWFDPAHQGPVPELVRG